MKEVELLCDDDIWKCSLYETKKELLKQYPDAELITTTNKYQYYVNGTGFKLLYRVLRLPTMTKKEAEEKYNIEIQG